MRHIPFSYVNTRKLGLQCSKITPKISYQTVSNNLNVPNLLSFIESANDDSSFKSSIDLYNRLLETSEVSKSDKAKVRQSLSNKLINLQDIDSVFTIITGDEIQDKDMAVDYSEIMESIENCDRVIRNESKIAKRFNFNKIITENILYGTKQAVFELCSLIDTYSVSNKAKLNIALENVLYSLYKSGQKVDLNEATEYIVEYFLTRESVITDKDYDGYINVLESNKFIDSSIDNISYVFEAHKEKANSFKNTASELVSQCETKECASHMSKLANIKNEKQASKYIDDSMEMIMNNTVSKNDQMLLLKSIYTLPLIGNVSKQFVNYKVETSRNKLSLKKKFATKENKKLINDILDDGEMIDYVDFVSETVHFKDYILDDSYEEETDSVRFLEGYGSSNEIPDIIKSFKASNKKDMSTFKNMMYKIMAKSPESIIDETPSVFAVARTMIILGVAASSPLGPIFALIMALINKLLSTHMNYKQAKKLLKHLRDEKEKAEKKLEKVSDKEKEAQEEYIDCINKAIKKVEKFIQDIDEDDEDLSANKGGDDFDFDFDDDDDSDDFDVDLESVMENGTIFSDSLTNDILSMIDLTIDGESLTSLATLFENYSENASNDFYALVENMKETTIRHDLKLVCENLLNNRGSLKLYEEPTNYVIQYEAAKILYEISGKNDKEEKEKKFHKPDIKGKFNRDKDDKNNKDKNQKDSKFNKDKNPKDEKKKKTPKINIARLKMLMVNFRKKFQDLRGKEKELWRNIDLYSSQLYKGIEKALTSDRREAIIKGSIIPSFSKCIKFAITIGAIEAFTGPVGAAISAVGMLGASAALNERERRLIYDEIDTELQVVEKQQQLAESEGDMNQYRFLLNYEKKLKREKYRIKYGIHSHGRTIPELKGGGND